MCEFSIFVSLKFVPKWKNESLFRKFCLKCHSDYYEQAVEVDALNKFAHRLKLLNVCLLCTIRQNIYHLKTC